MLLKLLSASLAALQIATTLPTSASTIPLNWIDVPDSQVIKIDCKSRRVYLFGSKGIITSYQVSIGKKGWETPIGSWQIRDKLVNPGWTNFITRKFVPPGINNPMGSRWMGFWTDGRDEIGFHGTQLIDSIGKAASHGCIRMREVDIKDLFDRVAIGTTVIVN